MIHYNTQPPSSRPCDGLLIQPDEKSWHHVAATVDQVNRSAASIKIYVNGTVRASTVVSSKGRLSKPLTMVGEMGLAIGRSDPGRAPPLTGPFSPSLDVYNSKIEERQGSETFWAAGLDEMRMWNVSRSSEEILAGMTLTCKNSSFDGDAPVLCYSFDHMDLHTYDGKMHLADLGLAPAVDAQAVVGDRFASWCTTLGDNGVLVDKVVPDIQGLSCFLRGITILKYGGP